MHTHAWGLKYLVFAGFLVGMFFVDNSAFCSNMGASRWGGGENEEGSEGLLSSPPPPPPLKPNHTPRHHDTTTRRPPPFIKQTTTTEVFNGYVHLARIASLLYLVAQVVTLINFSCAWRRGLGLVVVIGCTHVLDGGGGGGGGHSHF